MPDGDLGSKIRHLLKRFNVCGWLLYKGTAAMGWVYFQIGLLLCLSSAVLSSCLFIVVWLLGIVTLWLDPCGSSHHNLVACLASLGILEVRYDEATPDGGREKLRGETQHSMDNYVSDDTKLVDPIIQDFFGARFFERNKFSPCPIIFTMYQPSVGCQILILFLSKMVR